MHSDNEFDFLRKSNYSVIFVIKLIKHSPKQKAMFHNYRDLDVFSVINLVNVLQLITLLTE